MYDLMEYSDNYSKRSGMLCQFFRDTRALASNGCINDFNEDNATTCLFKIIKK